MIKLNSIFKRKSIRKFINKEIEDEKIEKIINAGMQAPSAHNTQPWEFIIVKNRESIEKIANMSPYAKPALNGNTVIITVCNMENIEKKKTQNWIEQDMSACTQNILLEAVELGLGGVWLGTYPEEDRVNLLKEEFNIPDNHIPFSTIVLGYCDDYTRENNFNKSKIHYETY